MPKKQNIISNKQVSVNDLLELIGISTIETLAKTLGSDKWVPKLKTTTVFKLILYSILETNQLSLRTMEENYCSPIFKAIEESLVDERTAHSSIRDRLINIDVRFFTQLYDKVYSLLSEQYAEKQLKDYNIKRYDSTMVAVFSHLLTGMKVGNSSKNKRQVKFSTTLENDIQIQMSFFKDQAYLSEEVALKQTIEQATHSTKDIIVFDRGLKSRKSFKAFKDNQTLFVTRLHNKTRYKHVRKHKACKTIAHEQVQFIQDSIVYLYTDGHKLLKEEFRLIEAINKEDGKPLWFLTNMLDLTTAQIAYVYKQRWQIEVLFRFLKQEMNLTHFVCNHSNAIQVILYCTLIAAMLILVYKKKNGITSYKFAKTQFFKELQASVILELIETPGGFERFKLYLKYHVHKL